MIDRVVRWFVAPDANPNDPQIRQRYGALAGAIGIGLNLILFLGKILSGMITGSIAMIADAVNNLSDAATSVVTLMGFRLAGHKADAEHPFGHGRAEYLSGLMVALAVLLMGVEVGKSSISRLFHPEPVEFSWPVAVILAVAVGIKLWMAQFNRKLGKKIDSIAMQAVSVDSLSDAAATSVVLLSMFVERYLSISIDGLAGLLVAVFILKTGWETVKDTIDPLLGRPMDAALAESIDRLVVSHPNILGVHDLIYHDYGPGRAMMSFHAEVPAEGNFLELHDIIDHIEREMKQEHGIETVVHMDPVVCDERTEALRSRVAELARGIHPRLTIHDFRITPGPLHTNLIFDIVIPYGLSMGDQQVAGTLRKEIEEMEEALYAVIEIDHSYVDTCKQERDAQ